MEWLRRWVLFLPPQASTFSQRVDAVHVFIITATMVVAAGVGVAGLLFLVKYHRRHRFQRTPNVVAPVWLESLFVGVPLSFFLLWFALGFRDYGWVVTAPPDALDVYVTGKQWMWKFSYPEGPGEVGRLVVPAGRPVRLLLTSRDVIHSFFVPDFRIKRDALPGRYTEVWFQALAPGRHLALCTEYCGLNHSHMRAEVVVLPAADFEAWRREGREGLPPAEGGGPVSLAQADMVQRGRAVAAAQGCLKCHSVDGSAHIGPTWLGLYRRTERLEGGGEVVADVAYLTESMMEPDAKVVAGFAPVMPSFLGRLADGETAALVEYIKSLQPARPGAAVTEEPVYVPRGR